MDIMNRRTYIFFLITLLILGSSKADFGSRLVVNQTWYPVYYPTSQQCIDNGYNLFKSVSCETNLTACPYQVSYNTQSGSPTDVCFCGYNKYVWYPYNVNQCLGSHSGCPTSTCIQYYEYPDVAKCGTSTNVIAPNVSWSSPCLSRTMNSSWFYQNFTCSWYPKHWINYNCNADDDGYGISNPDCVIGLNKSLFFWPNGSQLIINTTPSSGTLSGSIMEGYYNLTELTSGNYTVLAIAYRAYIPPDCYGVYHFKVYLQYMNGTNYATLVYREQYCSGGSSEISGSIVSLINTTEPLKLYVYLIPKGSGFSLPVTHIRLWFTYPTVYCNIWKSSDYTCGNPLLSQLSVGDTVNISSLYVDSFYYNYLIPSRPRNCVENVYYNATNAVCYKEDRCLGCYQCGNQYATYVYDFPNVISGDIKAIDMNGNGIRNLNYKLFLYNRTSGEYLSIENNDVVKGSCYDKHTERKFNCSNGDFTDVNGYASFYITNVTSQNYDNNLTYVIRITYLNETKELFMLDNCSYGSVDNTTFLISWVSTSSSFCPHMQFNTTLIGNCTSDLNCSYPICYNDECIAYNGRCNAGICTDYVTFCNLEWGRCINNRFECLDTCVVNLLNQSILKWNGRWNNITYQCEYDTTICSYGCSYFQGKPICACLENTINCLDGVNLYKCVNGTYILYQACQLGCYQGNDECKKADISKCGRPCYKNGWNSSLEDTSEIIKTCDYNEYCVWEYKGSYGSGREITPIYEPKCVSGSPCTDIINAELGIGYCGCNETSLCVVENSTKRCVDYTGRYYQGRYIGVDYWKGLTETLGIFNIFFSSLFILSFIALILSGMVSYYSRSIPLGLASLLLIMLIYFTLLPDLYPRWISLVIILSLALYLTKVISENFRRG